MFLMTVEKDTGIPAYQQIISEIVSRVENGRLQAGEQMPSSRTLASKLGVHRSTVFRAYQELLALGYIESKPGTYTTIRDRKRLVGENERPEKGLIDWDSAVSTGARIVYDIYTDSNVDPEPVGDSDTIALSRLTPDPRLFPVETFRKCLNRAMVNQQHKLLLYGDRQGWKPLRKYIASRMSQHGVVVDPDEVLITSGSQQALDLIFKLLIEPGNGVVIEAPTYAHVIPLMRFYQADLRPVPMTPEGMDLETLERQLESQRPSFIYTIPNFQNPTGITSSQENRERLLHLAEEHRVPILEDGFDEEMKYFGKTVLPIKSMDRKQAVVYMGTFSKVLFPGVRIGWIIADRECIERLVAIRRYSDLAGVMAIQAGLEDFCRNGYYDLHIKRMHRAFRKRMQTALDSLKVYLPDGYTWTTPDGGYLLWVTMPQPYQDQKRFTSHLMKHGVTVSPGEYHYFSEPSKSNFRISIAYLDEDQIAEGIKRLGKALATL